MAKKVENKKKILILGDKAKSIVSLKRVLEDSDFPVMLFPNTGETIDFVLKEAPELIIVNLEEIKSEEFKLCEMLRSNPSSYKIPFIFLTPKDIYGDSVPKFVTTIDRFIHKPFNLYMALSYVIQILTALEKMEILSSSFKKTIKGDLRQIPFTDLIQIFFLNKKSGLLTILYQTNIAKIYFNKGSIVSAYIGNIHGIKAVLRLIALKSGNFEFDPNILPKNINVTMNTEWLLLEGMRQIDEIENIKESFPPLETTIVVNKKSDISKLKTSKVLSEILKLSQSKVTIKEVIDNSTFPDSEVYEGLRILFENNIIQPHRGQKNEEKEKFDPLIYKEEFFKLHRFFKQIQWTEGENFTAKLLIIPGSYELEKAFIRSLEMGFKDFSTRRKIYRIEGKFGDLGSFRITQEAFLSILIFPALKEFSPLWELLSNDRIGAIVLLASKNLSSFHGLKEAAQFLSSDNSYPLIYAVMNPNSEADLNPQTIRKKLSLPSSADIIFYQNSNLLSVKAVLRKVIKKLL